MLTAFVRHDLFLSYDTIGDQIRNAALEVQRFSRRAIRTLILFGKISTQFSHNLEHFFALNFNKLLTAWKCTD